MLLGRLQELFYKIRNRVFTPPLWPQAVSLTNILDHNLLEVIYFILNLGDSTRIWVLYVVSLKGAHFKSNYKLYFQITFHNLCKGMI